MRLERERVNADVKLVTVVTSDDTTHSIQSGAMVGRRRGRQTAPRGGASALKDEQSLNDKK